MEVAMSAVTGELVNRFISFLIHKYRSQACLEEKLERLQQLLLRVHTVVEEAEGRNITNSRMLIQLEKLANALYRGYHVLDTFKYRMHEVVSAEEEVSSSYAMSCTTPVKHFRRITSITRSKANNHDLERTLGTLESLVANMTEFVILLGGCKRMFHRPYDSYVYIDSFFGRHVEKQKIINISLEKSPDLGAPTVIPIIGGRGVGKKTLVAHVCSNDLVRSHFSSILHFSGDDVISRMNSEKFMPVKILIVVEFVFDVEDEDWAKFYQSTTHMGRGSKVIIISRIEKLARFGTVKPIFLNNLSHEESSYLFKVLAFGSTNPEDHPRLASIAEVFATLFEGYFIPMNIFADVLRKNLNVQFWLRILKMYQNVVESNLSIYGEPPKLLIEKDHPADISKFALLPSDGRLRLMPPYSKLSESGLPQVKLADLMVGSTALPKGDFELVAWESRLPPYTKLATTCVEEKPQHKASPSEKRRRLDKY